MVDVVINLVTSLLLLVTTTWCILVYGRLRRFSVERDELEACVAALDRASDRAEAVLATWRAECAGRDQADVIEPAGGEHHRIGSRPGMSGSGGRRHPPAQPAALAVDGPGGRAVEGAGRAAALGTAHPSPRSRPTGLVDLAAVRGDGGRPSFAGMDKLR